MCPGFLCVALLEAVVGCIALRHYLVRKTAPDPGGDRWLKCPVHAFVDTRVEPNFGQAAREAGAALYQDLGGSEPLLFWVTVGVGYIPSRRQRQLDPTGIQKGTPIANHRIH